jgi:hypothetical protein
MVNTFAYTSTCLYKNIRFLGINFYIEISQHTHSKITLKIALFCTYSWRCKVPFASINRD